MNNVLIPPVALIPAYGGYIRNGQIIGYGSIRDNVRKINMTGFFSGGVLQPTGLVSSYTEWTAAPELIFHVIGDFKSGKLNGHVYKYMSENSLYCDAGNNSSNVLVRRRYVRANKIDALYNMGVVETSTSLGNVTLMMNWAYNNLLNVFDIGDIDISGPSYEIDNAVRIDSHYLALSNKSSLNLSVLN